MPFLTCGRYSDYHIFWRSVTTANTLFAGEGKQSQIGFQFHLPPKQQRRKHRDWLIEKMEIEEMTR